MPPFPSAPSSPATNIPQNVAADLLLSLSGNEYPSKRRRRPPLIPLRQRIPLKTSPQISFYPSPATNTPQNVAAGLLLSLSGNEYPSKRRRRPPLIPLRQRIPLKTSPQAPSDPSPATIPLKTLPQASSYPSPATNNPQNVAGGLLLSLSGDKNPSKRRRRSPFIPPRQRIPLKASPEASSNPSPATNTPQNVAGGLL